ncbi:MAG: PAS domain-containing protein [Bacteroidales bacterium]|nr:PAS domain-containing protein [Bacteroidales bacterium]
MMKAPDKKLDGKNIFEILPDEEKKFFNEFWPRLLENQTYKGIYKKLKEGEDPAFIMATFTPVNNENGKIYKIYFLGQDITEQKQRYNLLVEANKEIERLRDLLDENKIKH